MSLIEIDDEKGHIKVNYQIQNEKPKESIVFIHGLSDSLEFWEPLYLELGKEYKVIRYDLRGHGKSEFKPCEPLVETFVKDLYNLLKKLEIKEAVLIGLSLGGNIALKYAIDHPDMVKGLVLMSTYSEVTPELLTPFKTLEDALNQSYEKFFDTILPYCISQETIDKYKDFLNGLKVEKAKAADMNGLLNAVKACSNFNVTNDLKKIEKPTIIFSGDEDQLTKLEVQEIIQKNVKNSELVVFKNTKHNILIEGNIEKALDLIKKFLKEKVWK